MTTSTEFDTASHPARPAWLGRLPVRLASPFLRAPFALQRPLLMRMFNRLFAAPLKRGEFDFMQGRCLEVACDEPAVRWYLTCSRDRKLLMRRTAQADATIRGSFRGLLQLAAQRVDPDTLFFNRELVVEGDTELGLQVKNLLDRLDTLDWPPELLFAVRSAAEWMDLFDRAD